MSALIDISNQMLEDSAFDMEGEVLGEATEQFAVKKSPNPRHPPGQPELQITPTCRKRDQQGRLANVLKPSSTRPAGS